MALADLTTLPDGYAAAADAIDKLDQCFLVGFSRLGPDQVEGLHAFTAAFAGTPLGAALTEAVEALGRNEFREAHFARLAAGRAALQGAQYDALREQVAQALGRKLDPTEPPAFQKATGPAANWGESARHWLTELAVAGFKQLESGTLAPFAATLAQLEGKPALSRQASLLSGFLAELIRHAPTNAQPDLPLFRWADLWTRGFLGSYRAAATPTGTTVSGTFYPFGCDERAHGTFASVAIHGLFESKGTFTTARVTLNTYKVDALRGPEVWRCFPKTDRPLFDAIAERKAVAVSSGTLLPSGELLPGTSMKLGKPFDPLALAATHHALSVASADPMDRHPLQLAEWTTGDDFAAVPVYERGLSPWADVTAELLAKAERAIGLLRFDGGQWQFQPLATQTGGKKAALTLNGQSAVGVLTSTKKKADSLATLRERASRLLRQKG